jgi:hypothetical protein
MAPAWFSLIGVVVGFLLGQGASYLERRRARKRYRDALYAEIALCERDARTYTNAAVIAPLYRLPTFVFPVSFPVLLGCLRAGDVEDLLSFELLVQEINRGLDNVHRALEANDQSRALDERTRLQMKCDKLVNAHGDGQKEEAYVARARRALGRLTRMGELKHG